VGFVSEATYSCSFLGVFGFDECVWVRRVCLGSTSVFGFDECVGAVLRRVNDKFVWLTS